MNKQKLEHKELNIFGGRSVFIEDVSPQNTVLDYLLILKNESQLNAVSYHFACFVYQQLTSSQKRKLTDVEVNLVVALSAKVMEQLQQQDTCLHISQLDPDLFDVGRNGLTSIGLLELPDKALWQEILIASGVANNGNADILPNDAITTNPLTLAYEQLYLTRYYDYEVQVYELIRQSMNNQSTNWFSRLSSSAIENVVGELFPSSGLDETDWQKVAVTNSINKRFSIICGGPGTGKTTTVIKLLIGLLNLHQTTKQNDSLDIKLCAPTGKAAQRLGESIGNSLSKMNVSRDIRASIPKDAMTIHRLLKPIGQNKFYHNKQNKLAIDVLILDEASMVDLSLMAKVIQALPERCQLILLGDKEQLASVEAGNVLAEISATKAEQSAPFITELKKSYRFNDQSGIGHLAAATKAGSVKDFLATMDNLEHWGDIRWFEGNQEGFSRVLELVVDHYVGLIELCDLTIDEDTMLQRVFAHLSRLQLLTCIRKGDFGVDGINAQVRHRLVRKGLATYDELHYHGRPIMISENAYHLNLYNGDVGIELIDPVSGQLMAYFLSSDGSFNKLFCQRLPAHDTVYAMTVHKSQGSEFEHAVLVMPDSDTMVNRELIYTGLTRAKKQFTLCASRAAIKYGVANRTERKSGLARLLEVLSDNS